MTPQDHSPIHSLWSAPLLLGSQFNSQDNLLSISAHNCFWRQSKLAYRRLLQLPLLAHPRLQNTFLHCSLNHWVLTDSKHNLQSSQSNRRIFLPSWEQLHDVSNGKPECNIQDQLRLYSVQSVLYQYMSHCRDILSTMPPPEEIADLNTQD